MFSPSSHLHSDTTVTVMSPDGKEESGKILGIDDCGYLKIQFNNNKIGSVTPDNNSFDLLRGLIVPKYQKL
jgi:biotin---protein ligase